MEPEEKEYKVTAMYCIRRTDELWSNNYDEYDNLNDPQREWEGLYMTPLELIDKCRELAEYMLEKRDDKYPEHVLRNIIEDCSGWENVECEIDQL